MNSLIVKKILHHKGIPEDIEQHIVQYIPLARQVRLKREMIIKLNYWYKIYWEGDCWTPRKSVPPKLCTYKNWRASKLSKKIFYERRLSS